MCVFHTHFSSSVTTGQVQQVVLLVIPVQVRCQTCVCILSCTSVIVPGKLYWCLLHVSWLLLLFLVELCWCYQPFCVKIITFLSPCCEGVKAEISLAGKCVSWMRSLHEDWGEQGHRDSMMANFFQCYFAFISPLRSASPEFLISRTRSRVWEFGDLLKSLKRNEIEQCSPYISLAAEGKFNHRFQSFWKWILASQSSNIYPEPEIYTDLLSNLIKPSK